MIFTFGEHRLDDRRLELHDTGGPVQIEPRVLETLIHLIRNRDRVVSKDELLEEVWRADHVSDSAVSRCIMEARRAVGDSGTDARVIKTIHGRGYRFVAGVEEVTDGDRSETGAATGTPRARIVGALAAILGAVAVLVLVLSARDGERPPVSPAVARVAILTSVGGDDPDLRWLAVTTEDSLRLGLTALPEIELVELAETEGRTAEEVLNGSHEDGSLRAVIRARFSPGKIAGFASIETDILYLRASELIEEIPIGSLVVPQFSPGGAPDRFASLREIVTSQAVARTKETLGPQRSENPDQREAWLLYLRAATQWEPACGAGGVLDLVDRSLELDPEFVPTWFMKGGLGLLQAKFCSGQVDDVADLERVVERTQELAPESPSPLAFRANLLLYQWQPEEAFVVLEQANERFPESLPILIGRSAVLRYAGFLVASRELFDEAVAQAPALPYVAGWVPYSYRYLGDWDGFMELMPGLEAPHFRFYRGLAENVLGNVETAIEVLEPAFEARPGDLYGRLSQALLSIIQGNGAEARVVLEQLARQRARQGGLDGEVTFEIGQLMIQAGDLEAGLEQLALAVDQGFFCGACLENDVALRRLSGTGEFDALVSRARQRQLAFAQRFGLP